VIATGLLKVTSQEFKKYDKGIICGSFDVIHPGYIRMFQDGKKQCKILVIALQGDPTLDRPDKCKPVQTLKSRIEILASIKYIDEIITYNTESELLNLLKSTPHDVRILGTDYKGREKFTGSELKKPIYYHERDHDFSTTLLKEAIYEERLNFKNNNDVE